MALESPLLLVSEEPAAVADAAAGRKFEVCKELRTQLTIALPMICVNMLMFLVQLTSVMFVGHLGELPLASASLASSSCNITGFTVLMGMGAALETLCGQAYGAKQHRLLGIYLQRAVLVLTLTSLPVTIIWLNMGGILRSLGQDPVISEHAGVYARWLIPGLFGAAWVWPLVKFLQAQSAVIGMACCSFVTVLIHVPLCWLFLFKLGAGAKGAAMCVSISYWLNAIFLSSYIRFAPRFRQTFTGLSSEAWRDFAGFFRLAIPASVMICLEASSFEIVTLLSGLLPNPQLETSSFTSVMNTLVLGYMVPFGLSAAASTRAANELGAGNPSAAKAAVGVTLSLGAVESVIVVTLLLSFRKVVGYAFSSEEEVVNHIASLFKVAVFIAACDPIQGILTGVSRGCGWQGVGALANLLAFYVVGLPVAVTLAFFYGLNGKGLWMGIASGNATQTVTLCLITLFTNWEKQAVQARERISRSLVNPALVKSELVA